MTKHWTVGDIPDQSGRIAVVTGANTGLGLETARALAARGARVVVAVRDTAKGDTAAASIVSGAPGAEVEVQALDLSSLESVRAAADDLRSLDQVDLLINNAGVMYTPQQKTADGFDLQFGVNHLGHFALTGLLFDQLMAAPNARVVSVSSIGHRLRSKIDFDDLDFSGGYSRVAAYGRSKLANLLFTYELDRRLRAAGVTTAALAAHPGVSSTELVRYSPAFLRVLERPTRFMLQSAAMGALPSLRAATDPTAQGGQYYGPAGIGELRGRPRLVASSGRSHDPETQAHLWSVSEELTGVTYPV
jgi:NAD(P)-dependent dehydrogenase (short-subunit alcohol dehydrogenase family)